MFEVAICDDDKMYHKTIKEIMEYYDDVKQNIVFYDYVSGEELLESPWHKYDIVFLDIQMPKIDGNETAKILRKECNDTVLVFCTSYQKPTSESFKVRPFRYIMKDISDKMLKAEMRDIIDEMLRKANDRYLNVTADGKLMRVPIKSILYITVAKRGAIINTYPHCREWNFNCRETIKEIYEVLKEEGFEYAHNSYIVNMSNIIELRKNVLVLKDNTKLNISRSRKGCFDESFMNHLQKKYKRR